MGEIKLQLAFMEGYARGFFDASWQLTFAGEASTYDDEQAWEESSCKEEFEKAPTIDGLDRYNWGEE